MKSQRRFLVVLLALAIAMSCFAVMAFAEGENYSYLDMLEYYEAGYYLNEQFDGEGELFADSSDELVLSGNYSCVVNEGKGTFGAATSANVFTVVPADSDGFGLNIKGKNIAAGRGSSIKLQLVKDSAAFDVLDVFTVNNGNIEYANAVFDSISGKVVNTPEKFEDEAFAHGTEFTLAFFYDGEFASIEVEGIDEVLVLNLAEYDYSEIKLVFFASEFDYIEMYNGSFARRLANREDTVGDMMLEIMSSNPTVADCEAVAKIYGLYGFDSSKMTDPDKAATVDEYAVSALSDYANSVAYNFVEGANAIAASNDYTAIKDLVAVLIDYDTVLNTVESAFADKIELEISADVISEKREILENAKVWLVDQKENTIKSIELLDSAPDVFTATYKQLYTFYESYKLAPICGTYYDDEYSQDFVNECFEEAELLKDEFLRVDAMAKAFAQNVPVAADDTLTFGDRYAAYSIAKENVFNDVSYNEFLDGVTVEELNSTFSMLASVLADKADYANRFLAKMEEARTTLSYSVLQRTLDEAEVYLDNVEVTIQGVAEAKALYDALRTKISDAKVAAEDYINAVLAVQAATTTADKKAAIAIAKEKAVLGSDVSLDVSVGEGENKVTVRDANIILSDEESKIVLAEVKNGNFIDAVNAIADATDVLEKRLAILNAINLLEAANENVQAVKEAVNTLNDAIDAYDAEVESSNATAKQCNDTAAATVEKTVLTKVAADIVAIIKKFF